MLIRASRVPTSPNRLNYQALAFPGALKDSVLVVVCRFQDCPTIHFATHRPFHLLWLIQELLRYCVWASPNASQAKLFKDALVAALEAYRAMVLNQHELLCFG